MANVELTQEEIGFVHSMLDQVSVKGTAQKRIVLAVMEKLEASAIPPVPEPEDEEPEEPDEESAKKK